MQSLKYVCPISFQYFCGRLTLEHRDLEVLDHALETLEQKTYLITQLIAHASEHGMWPSLEHDDDQYIISMDKIYHPQNGNLSISTVTRHSAGRGLTPALHIDLMSPTLCIPQRFEIPLRYVLKGMPPVKGRHIVYLHVLEINNSRNLVYYGITKRNWMTRFNEHVVAAVKTKSPRKFAATLARSVEGRADYIYANAQLATEAQSLTGSYHVICAAGCTKSDAQEAEAYLIKKHGLNEDTGLNMINGKSLRS